MKTLKSLSILMAMLLLLVGCTQQSESPPTSPVAGTGTSPVAGASTTPVSTSKVPPALVQEAGGKVAFVEFYSPN